MVEIGQLDMSNPEHLEPMQDAPSKPTKEQNRTSMWFIGVFLIGIFLVLFLLINASNDPEKEIRTLDDLFLAVIDGTVSEERGYVYNGYVFAKDDQDTWFTRLQVENTIIEIPLHFTPRDLQQVDDSGLLNSSFAQKDIYITFEPNSTQMQYIALSAAELSLNLAKGINARPIASCMYQDNVSCIDRPIITCDDAVNKSVIAIQIDELSPEGRVVRDGTCVTLSGDEFGLLKAVDLFLLKWYGII